jgi:hypothetical protein
VALSGLKTAGEFNVLTADLILSTGETVGLKASILGLTIFESIDDICLTGSIIIQDSINLASFGPLIGQEYLKLKIATPSLSGEDNIIDYTDNAFMITSLDERTDIGNGAQGSILTFVSREFIVNQRSRIRRTLIGTYSDIVNQVLRKDLDSAKKFYIEPSVDSKKIISPNITPFGAIGISTKNAVSKKYNDATYIFFENTLGFNFKTLGNLYFKPPTMLYEYTIPGTRTKNGVKDIIQELSTIENYKVTGAPDTVYNYTTGIYSSELIVHDVISKSYKTHTYNYIDSFDKERHIDLFGKSGKAYPLVNKLKLTKDGKNVSSFPSKQYLQPTVGFDIDESYEDDFNQYSFTANRSPNVLQSRGSQMAMLQSALQLSLDVIGNTTVSAGDIIELRIPSTGVYKSTEPDRLDTLYNGNFMIRSLRHDFDITTNKHTMSMNVTKDSIGKNLFAPTDNTEPKSESPPKTIIEDWGDPA